MQTCGRRVVLIYEWKMWEVKCLGLYVMGHAKTVRSTAQASCYIIAEREWRAGLSPGATGGRPGDTAVIPNGSTTTPLAGVKLCSPNFCAMHIMSYINSLINCVVWNTRAYILSQLVVLLTTTSITFTETITSEFPQCPITTVIDHLIDCSKSSISCYREASGTNGSVFPKHTRRTTSYFTI